jgi:KaiC/GvpD/RAD55 family RecA-like ATPase
MKNISVGFEIVILHHIARKPEFFKRVEEDYFKNKYIKRLYKICKEFNNRYAQIPFDVDDVSTKQIEEILANDETLCIMEDGDDPLEMKQTILKNFKNILNADYKKYNKEYIESSFKNWLIWNNFESSVDNALTYVKSVEITSDNVSEIVASAMELFYRGGEMMLDDDEALSFWDSESHVQPLPSEVFSTGYTYKDSWLGKLNGTQAGHMTLYIGATSIGKSIVLVNDAYGLALNGYNVALASLEMSATDIVARMGANAFDTSINSYDNFASNQDMVQLSIDEVRSRNSKLTPVGEILVKQFASATPNELNNWVLSEEKARGIKIHALVIDYLGELGNDYGIRMDSGFGSYMYHKTNTQSLSKNAIKNKYAVISAHQDKDINKEAEDITLSSLSESSGISHKIDTIIGLLQPPASKANKMFYMKNLKARHTPTVGDWIELGINYEKMRLTELARHDVDFAIF